MAKLPDLQSQGSAAPRPAGGIAPGAGATGMEGGLARELAVTGQQFREAGAYLERAQEEHDTLRAEDAFNQLRAKQNELEVGQDGFAQLQGDQVVKQPVFQNYTQRLQSSTDEISKGLENDNQRQLFQRRAAVTATQFQGDLLKHIAAQTDAYRTNVYKTTVSTETQNAAAHWSDPNAIGLSVQRIKAAVASEGRVRGWDKPTQAAELQSRLSLVHKDVIVQALANENYDYAKAYFDKNRKDIDPTTSSVLAKGVEQAKQKQLSATLRGQFLDQRDSIVGLKALEKTVNGSELDDDRKNVLLSAIMGREDTLANKARVEQDKRDRVLQKGLDDATGMILKGFEPNSDQLDGLLAQTKGTDLEDQAKEVAALAKATTSFRGLSPAQQQAQITDLEGQVRKAPTSKGVKILTALKSIAGAQAKELKEDPITFAGRQGKADVQPLPFDQPDQLGPALKDRFALGRALQQRDGAPFKPLTSAETTAIGSHLKQATPQQKAEFFGSLAKASDGDVGGYSAIMGQLAPGDPVTAVAGEFWGKNRIPVAQDILAGQAILNPTKEGKPDQGKLWPMPADKDLRAEFQGIERDAFASRPEQRNAIYQAALALYAKRSADAGDASGVLDNKRYDQALQDVAGQIIKWNGKGTALPIGMAKGDFKDSLRGRINYLIYQNKLDPRLDVDRVMDLPLEQVGDGRYMFRSGQSILVGKDGQPVIVDFNKPFALVPEGSHETDRRPIVRADMTSNYNTGLSPADEAAFEKQFGPADSYDYDMRGAFKAGLTKGHKAGAHYPDTYKKPNHPTFSTESVYSKGNQIGGRWEQKGGKWTFYASRTNLHFHSAKELRDYFARVEPDSTLVLPRGYK